MPRGNKSMNKEEEVTKNCLMQKKPSWICTFQFFFVCVCVCASRIKKQKTNPHHSTCITVMLPSAPQESS